MDSDKPKRLLALDEYVSVTLNGIHFSDSFGDLRTVHRDLRTVRLMVTTGIQLRILAVAVRRFYSEIMSQTAVTRNQR